MTLHSTGFLRRLFGFPDANRDIVEALYAEIVAAARRPILYSQDGAPDTPLGRFEMLSLHMVLVQRRLSGKPQLRELAQDLTDAFFADVDDSLRQLGIGDMGVPKRMKKLARMFYGRAESYSAALDADDSVQLALALGRNVTPDRDSFAASGLAERAVEAMRTLAAVPDSELLAGRLGLTDPAASRS